MTWLYENVTCDDLHCGTLVYRTAELPQGREVTPGFWQEANRVMLRFHDAADALREEGRQRYGEEVHVVNYFVTLYFDAQPGIPAKNAGKKYSILLTGLY